jgi:hypothetical protein
MSAIILLIVSLLIYFIPTFVARASQLRRHRGAKHLPWLDVHRLGCVARMGADRHEGSQRRIDQAAAAPLPQWDQPKARTP